MIYSREWNFGHLQRNSFLCTETDIPFLDVICIKKILLIKFYFEWITAVYLVKKAPKLCTLVKLSEVN